MRTRAFPWYFFDSSDNCNAPQKWKTSSIELPQNQYYLVATPTRQIMFQSFLWELTVLEQFFFACIAWLLVVGFMNVLQINSKNGVLYFCYFRKIRAKNISEPSLWIVLVDFCLGLFLYMLLPMHILFLEGFSDHDELVF